MGYISRMTIHCRVYRICLVVTTLTVLAGREFRVLPKAVHGCLVLCRVGTPRSPTANRRCGKGRANACRP